MFTGIIEELGSVTHVTRQPDSVRLEIAAQEVLADAAIGDSIAVNGVCLTAIELSTEAFVVDMVPETIERTSMAHVREGDQVNLERPTRIGGRLDGHIVQGHVDGVGEVRRVEHGDDGAVTMYVSLPAELERFVVEKGSITIDGVSLTVASLSGNDFSVALIPHTLAVTTLGSRSAGDAVNLEVDIIAKYVARNMEAFESR